MVDKNQIPYLLRLLDDDSAQVRQQVTEQLLSFGPGLEAELAHSLRQIFGDIQVAVREVAKEMKIELVLATDQLPPDTPPKTAQARQQILLQKVLFFTPQVDITDQIVARVNAIHKQKTAARTPSAPTQP